MKKILTLEIVHATFKIISIMNTSISGGQKNLFCGADDLTAFLISSSECCLLYLWSTFAFQQIEKFSLCESSHHPILFNLRGTNSGQLLPHDFLVFIDRAEQLNHTSENEEQYA